jgi:uncharacterized protein YfdQ (DUF2303 family)
MVTYPATAYTTAPAVDLDGVQSVIDIAQQAARPAKLELGEYYTIVTPSGVEKIDLTGDQYRSAPARKAGTTTVRDARSFVTYFTKHADEASEVFADAARLTVTAVLDAHQADSARWGGHRVVLELRKTPAWNAWIENSGRMLKQGAFAEFIEDNLADIASPPGATMLELAQSFEATTKADFKSGTVLATGERRLTYTEETTASAGKKGDLVIPASFDLGLQPFEGADPYKVSARLRYRITDGTLLLGYKLDRPEDTLTAAFADITEVVASEITAPILNGTPASR